MLAGGEDVVYGRAGKTREGADRARGGAGSRYREEDS